MTYFESTVVMDYDCSDLPEGADPTPGFSGIINTLYLNVNAMLESGSCIGLTQKDCLCINTSGSVFPKPAAGCPAGSAVVGNSKIYYDTQADWCGTFNCQGAIETLQETVDQQTKTLCDKFEVVTGVIEEGDEHLCDKVECVGEDVECVLEAAEDTYEKVCKVKKSVDKIKDGKKKKK